MTKTERNVAIGLGVLAALGIGTAIVMGSKPAAASTSTTPTTPTAPPVIPPPGVLTPATTLQPNHQYQATLTGLPAGTSLSTVQAVQSFLDTSQGPGLFQVTNLAQSANGQTITVSFNYLGTVPLPVSSLAGTGGLPANLQVYDLGPIPSAG
jgi:hypothetical protein